MGSVPRILRRDTISGKYNLPERVALLKITV
jgi:hypothetical protein